MWGNKHWTRAKFLRVLVREFEKRDIRNERSLKKWATAAEFDRDVKGQFRAGRHGIGPVLFNWLKIRVGVNTIKADTHVQKFVNNAIGRLPSNNEIVQSLEAVAERLGWQAARLDSAIWDFQRSGQPTNEWLNAVGNPGDNSAGRFGFSRAATSWP